MVRRLQKNRITGSKPNCADQILVKESKLSNYEVRKF